MKQNKSSKEELELTKIRKKLINRYQIYDKYLLEELSESLLKNGIGIDKFNKKYYQESFDLDEIVYHLINKIIEKRKLKIKYPKKNKIIKFKNRKN